VREEGRVLRQALALAALSVLVAAAVHVPLIRRFVRGDFRQAFIQAAEYPGLRLITIEEGEELWRTGGAAFIDARPAGTFEEKHIPGARNLPASEGEKRIPAAVLALPRGGPLVVYCEGGDCQSSLLLAKRLHAEGFEDVRVMTGGWADWVQAGLPVESDFPGRRDGQA